MASSAANANVSNLIQRKRKIP